MEEERVRTRGISYLNIPYMDPMAFSTCASLAEKTCFARDTVLFGLGYSHFDAVMWSVLVSACEKGRSWEMALHVFGSLAKEKPCTLTLCNYMRGESPFQIIFQKFQK